MSQGGVWGIILMLSAIVVSLTGINFSLSRIAKALEAKTKQK